jgi:membrane-associated protease RseP (regulator of RpoE activity)
MAAWFGLLVTMLNLLPVGQLDGGHVTRAFFGPKAEGYGRWVWSAMLAFSLLHASWLVWVLMVRFLVGFGHPQPTDDDTPLSPGRRRASVLVWVLTALCFMPVPVDFLTL